MPPTSSGVPALFWVPEKIPSTRPFAEDPTTLTGDPALEVAIDDPSKRAVTLEDPASDVSLRIEFPVFPHLGLWSEPGDDFICSLQLYLFKNYSARSQEPKPIYQIGFVQYY